MPGMHSHRMFAAAALILAPGLAAADPVQSKLVSVFPIVATGDIDPNDKTAFEDLVRNAAGDALGDAGFKVLQNETQLKVLEDNGITAAQLEAACKSSCPLAAAKELNVRFFVSGSILRSSDGTAIASVRLFDGSDGTLIASDQFDGNNARDLREHFKAGAPALFAKGLRKLGIAAAGGGVEKHGDVVVAFGKGVLSVKTTPTGADLRVDDSSFGTAPAFDDLPAGTHHLRAELDGYAVVERDVTVQAGQTSKVVLELVRLVGTVTILDKMDVDASCTVGSESVSVSGGDVAQVTLPVGKHAVRCTASDRIDWDDTVRVVANENAKVELRMDEKPKGPPFSERAWGTLSAIGDAVYGLGTPPKERSPWVLDAGIFWLTPPAGFELSEYNEFNNKTTVKASMATISGFVAGWRACIPCAIDHGETGAGGFDMGLRLGGGSSSDFGIFFFAAEAGWVFHAPLVNLGLGLSAGFQDVSWEAPALHSSSPDRFDALGGTVAPYGRVELPLFGWLSLGLRTKYGLLGDLTGVWDVQATAGLALTR